MVTKKFYKIILCLLLIMCVGCQRKEVKVRTIYSDIYTEEEIQEAIDVIKKEFSKDWKGCTLKEIYYAGDDKALFTSYAKQYQGEEAIVLKTNSDGANDSSNPIKSSSFVSIFLTIIELTISPAALKNATMEFNTI